MILSFLGDAIKKFIDGLFFVLGISLGIFILIKFVLFKYLL